MKNSIRLERAKHSISQAELANKVDVSRQTINSLESGRYVPSSKLAYKIANFFNSKVEKIFILEANDYD